MSFFTDRNGRDWRIRLTGPVLAKIREATNIRLADPSGRGALEACADGEIQTRVLWLLCADQDPHVTPEQFAEAVGAGEVFDRAKEALRDAVADFTPPSQRPAMLKAWETEDQVRLAAMDLAIEQLGGVALKDQLVDALRTNMDQNLATILMKLRNAGDSPDLPDSTPMLLPIES